MVNETGPVPAPGQETGPVLALQNVYLKDCSYEAPSGPRLDGNWNPQINRGTAADFQYARRSGRHAG